MTLEYIPSDTARVGHLMRKHKDNLMSMEREVLTIMSNFCYIDPKRIFTIAQRKFLSILEAKYCTQICHALNKAGISHN